MKIILITGGQRSGKSEEAERLALSLSDTPIYIATAKIWDEEFRQRVKLHQLRRGPQWTNIEENTRLSRHNVSGHVVLIDCITLWATNFLFERTSEPNSDDVLMALKEMKDEFIRFTSQDATFIFVTNEIGMGGTSDNALQRHFTDLQGWINQFVAHKADEVYLMVSGIRVRIK
ncbi:MAG: bifunctional adenosylcobinamide kinase/adenosylcobinamide-phosphate guanylyltransferase [Bacteroidaceae bacterium]|nr:bifunctional adenosylcobinamide kinase/adenosylcobinamide-phosphate guanylyltransferase [Bacteroidaceae bacterium]